VNRDGAVAIAASAASKFCDARARSARNDTRRVACNRAATMKQRAYVASALVVVSCVVAACSDDGGPHAVEIGECAPPAGSVDVAGVTTASIDSGCLIAPTDGIAVVETVAQWDALFSCPTPVPDQLDLADQRIVVAHVQCSPLDGRFTVETADQIVVGVYQRISGACIDPPLVLGVPRSAKPVRLARCQEACEGDCPPVP
jgi:hypothetical protein